MNARTRRRAFVVPGVILLGIIIMVMLITSRKPPQQAVHAASGALVEVIEARRTTQDVIIPSHGEVEALHDVSVMPQVGGKVVWVHPDLVAGGTFMKNDLMLRIERDDYELGVQQAEAQVAAAEYQRQVAEANARIAREEWEMVNRNREWMGQAEGGQPDPLVLHEPQLKQAESALRSAEAMLRSAQLNLERTEIRAPFNARVRSENVSPGQLVGPSAPIARIYGTDIAEIEVSLPVSDLPYLEIPGARAEVKLDTPQGMVSWEGYVHREVGALSPTGRLARVIVRIDDPFTKRVPDMPTLQLGSFVDVELHGRAAEDVVVVPRAALRENDHVWIANGDSTLSIRSVDIHYRNRDNVLVTSGIEDGDLIVLTPLTGAAPGMALRPRLSESGASAELDGEPVRMSDTAVSTDPSGDDPPTADGESGS